MSYLKVAAARDLYIQEFEKEVWDTLGFDGVICPVLASPAVPHGCVRPITPDDINPETHYGLFLCW